MTVLRASNAPVGLDKGKPVRASGSGPTPWSRPSDWVTFTTPAANEQKVIGTVAVWNQASNYIALAATVSSGTYTVDWGDGTSANFTSGTTAEKNYVWGDISSSTLSSRGYRQAVITVTPTTGGETFSAVNLDKRHSAISSASTIATNPWLDVAVAAPNATTIAFSYDTAATRTVGMQLCEQVNIVAHNMTNMANLFREFTQLQSVAVSDTAAVTAMNGMFLVCYSLQTVPLFNTAAVTTMAAMFSSCYSLQTVPLFNTSSVTDMSSMFGTCPSLQTVPLFNTAAVTTMVSMFNGCSSLQTVPLFNTAAVTTMSSMFNGCSSLQTVPLFNTAAVTTMATMFNACRSLQTVPLFNTAAVTTMSTMFQGCSSLQTVPLFNTAAVTTMASMFSGCSSLQTVPLFNTAAVTSMNNMFNLCISLQNVPELTLTAISSNAANAMAYGNSIQTSAAANLGQVKLTGNRWSQTFQNCKLGAAQLDEMYTALANLKPNVTNVTGDGTNITYTVDDIRAFVAGRSVSIAGVDPTTYNITGTIGTVTPTTGNAGTFTVTNAATGTYVSGGVATITDNKTITVTNNPGTTGDDPTIATNKGWTVTV